MIDDENDLLGKQPRIHGVTDKPGTGNCVITFQVAVVIPCERRYPITLLQSESGQRIRELPGATETL